MKSWTMSEREVLTNEIECKWRKQARLGCDNNVCSRLNNGRPQTAKSLLRSALFL